MVVGDGGDGWWWSSSLGGCVDVWMCVCGGGGGGGGKVTRDPPNPPPPRCSPRIGPCHGRSHAMVGLHSGRGGYPNHPMALPACRPWYGAGFAVCITRARACAQSRARTHARTPAGARRHEGTLIRPLTHPRQSSESLMAIGRKRKRRGQTIWVTRSAGRPFPVIPPLIYIYIYNSCMIAYYIYIIIV